MDKKITARLSLASGNLDPINDILGIVDISAGAAGDKKITPNALFTGWGVTEAGANLVKATDLNSQRQILGVRNIISFDEFDSNINLTVNTVAFINTVIQECVAYLPEIVGPSDQFKFKPIEIFDTSNSFATNNLTISTDGLTKINGSFSEYVANVSGSHLVAVFVTDAIGWNIYTH